LEDLIEHWRATGGRIDLRLARLQSGTIKFETDGTLSLDDEHRPQGHLNAQLLGFEPILMRFGINPTLVGAGSFLNSLFGNSGQARGTGPTALRLPVVMDAGSLRIGPMRTSVHLPSLY
jgi:hypothetical protein